jgi:predicted dehydrogenase
LKTFTPNTSPALPASRRHGIGIIGAGGIVNYGHMPAYRAAGFNVVAIASRREETVSATATKWGITASFTDWRQLIELPEAQVVDVAYPFDEERMAIVEYAAERGKHILMQKPFAHSMENAQRMVEVARQHNVLLAVNQNARWCPEYRAARIAIEEGWIGRPYLIVHELQSSQDAQGWFQIGWHAQVERFQLLEYTVHHLDLMRFWFGREPTTVRASIGRRPGQHARGDMIASVQLSFDDGALAVIVDNNAAHPAATASARFHIEGTAGRIEGQVMPQPGLTMLSERTGAESHRVALTGSWFPDAFAGTMGELLCAIEQNRQPTISAEDNLHTLRLVFEAYANAGQP